MLEFKVWKRVDPSLYKNRDFIINNGDWIDSVPVSSVIRDMLNHYIFGRKSVWFSIHSSVDENITETDIRERMTNAIGYALPPVLLAPDVLLPDFYGVYPFLSEQNERGIFVKRKANLNPFNDWREEEACIKLIAEREHWTIDNVNPKHSLRYKYPKDLTLDVTEALWRPAMYDRNRIRYEAHSRNIWFAIAKASIKLAAYNDYPAKFHTA